MLSPNLYDKLEHRFPDDLVIAGFKAMELLLLLETPFHLLPLGSSNHVSVLLLVLLLLFLRRGG